MKVVYPCGTSSKNAAKWSWIGAFAIFLSICAFPAATFAQRTPPPTPSTASATPPPVLSANAREVHAKHQDRVVQVRVLRNAANEQSSLGSAFVVQDNGRDGAWLITNYHVISSHAINPDGFRLELRRPNEESVKATLAAIDVQHDLAVLKSEPLADGKSWPVFSFRESPAIQGERIYAMGNPLEVGFLIAEGVYNGLAEKRVYDQMIFSGALNSGMSGGPAIDPAGRVVGINVATHRHGQLISFLVPARFARDLLNVAQAKSTPTATPKNWRAQIGKQLTAHQALLSERLLGTVPTAPSGPSVPSMPSDAARGAGFASQTLSGRRVLTLDGSLTKCWADGRTQDKPRYHRESLQCTLNADVYVSRLLQTGSMRISHTLLRNEKLATPQFLALDRPGAINMDRFDIRPMQGLTPRECSGRYFKGAQSVYYVTTCVSGYFRFDGLYDFSMNATQVDNARERMSSDLTVRGFTFENAQRIGDAFMERLP